MRLERSFSNLRRQFLPFRFLRMKLLSTPSSTLQRSKGYYIFWMYFHSGISYYTSACKSTSCLGSSWCPLTRPAQDDASNDPVSAYMSSYWICIHLCDESQPPLSILVLPALHEALWQWFLGPNMLEGLGEPIGFRYRAEEKPCEVLFSAQWRLTLPRQNPQLSTNDIRRASVEVHTCCLRGVRRDLPVRKFG